MTPGRLGGRCLKAVCIKRLVSGSIRASKSRSAWGYSSINESRILGREFVNCQVGLQQAWGCIGARRDLSDANVRRSGSLRCSEMLCPVELTPHL